jgi:hypothetical protein
MSTFYHKSAYPAISRLSRAYTWGQEVPGPLSRSPKGAPWVLCLLLVDFTAWTRVQVSRLLTAKPVPYLIG